jgi:hypothetical protein
VNLYCGYASSIAEQNWAPHTCIWQGFDIKYSIFKAYNLKGFIPNHEDIQKADFDMRHLHCVITKLNSNWETVINTTKVYYYS